MKQINFDDIQIFIKDILSLTFESTDYRCLVCDAETRSADDYLCGKCKEKLSLQDKNTCSVCGRLNQENTCRYCRDNTKPYKKVYSIFEYAEPIDKYINEFKEQGKTIYGRMFVKSMIERYDDFELDYIDLITSVPANRIRKIQRLRDAPRFFAKALSKHTKIEYQKDCLKRRGNESAMRKKSPVERMKTANKSYIVGSGDVQNKHVLLVDDVFTTGATSHVCTNLLLEAGAKSVTILVMICVNSR